MEEELIAWYIGALGLALEASHGTWMFLMVEMLILAEALADYVI